MPDEGTLSGFATMGVDSIVLSGRLQVKAISYFSDYEITPMIIVLLTAVEIKSKRFVKRAG